MFSAFHVDIDSRQFLRNKKVFTPSTAAFLAFSRFRNWNFHKTCLARIFKIVQHNSVSQTDRHYINETLKYVDFHVKSMQIK